MAQFTMNQATVLVSVVAAVAAPAVLETKDRMMNEVPATISAVFAV